MTRAVLSRTARRYEVCDRFTRHYVASKLRMDPVHEAVLALALVAPFGGVLDLGCGRGQAGVALLEAGHATSVLALDQSAAVLRQLDLAATGLALRTQCVDLAEWHDGEPADTVLLIDVLYQFESDAQIALLRRAARVAHRAIIVRASDPARGWRSFLSACLERLGRHWWPTFGIRSNPLPPALLAETLAGCGFRVRSMPCAQGTPLAGVLLVGERVGAR